MTVFIAMERDMLTAYIAKTEKAIASYARMELAIVAMELEENGQHVGHAEGLAGAIIVVEGVAIYATTLDIVITVVE